MRFRRPEGPHTSEPSADSSANAPMENAYYWEKGQSALQREKYETCPPSEARVKCTCGENIVKKGIVRNNILLLEEDGSVKAVCPTCSRKIALYRSYELR